MGDESNDFKYIRNRVREYSKQDMLAACLNILNGKKDEVFPVWIVFTLMKWSMIHGGQNYPPKQLTDKRFYRLLNLIENFNSGHISSFLKKGEVFKAFQILYNQQLYLQKSIRKEIFATQLKLFSSITGKYDIEQSFRDKTGLSITDFLFILQLIFSYIYIEKLEVKDLYFNGVFDDDFLQLISEVDTPDNIRRFVNLLTVSPQNVSESISGFRHRIKKEELQTMEMTFFTMFPFIHFNREIRLIDKSVFNHTACYYLYDFMKAHDDQFTTEFGTRLEKYVALGLEEMRLPFKSEVEIKKSLPPKSNLIDFLVESENVLIECKAVELQAYPYVNPTDDLIHNSLKSSILKAYFKQILSVANQLNDDEEKWGIIITYKELFWSHFKELHEISKNNYNETGEFSLIPPENVFIIDLYTWDLIVEIVKQGKASISEILRSAKSDNSHPSTSKMLFGMHLDKYELRDVNLNFLQEELDTLDIRNRLQND